jgi:hypothetical protein
LFNFEGFLSRLFLPALVIFALLLFVACGGDDETDTGGDTEPTATERSEEEDTPEATEESGGDESGGTGTADLSALAAEYSDFTGVVKYETTGFGDDSFSSIKIYRGDGVSRVDYEGTDQTGTFITTAEGSFACAENQCIKLPAGQGVDPTAAFTGFLTAEAIEETYGDVPEGVDVEQSTEEIAGIEANCYTYSGDLDDAEAGDESGSVCFSESGILLRLEFDAASGGGKFEAVEAEEGVSDADFEPPYPVTEFPGS